MRPFGILCVVAFVILFWGTVGWVIQWWWGG